MTVAHRLNRTSIGDRVAALEKRAEMHEDTFKPVAAQVKEMYEAFDTAKKVLGALNWLWVKVAAWCFGAIGALAALLTIWEKAAAILHH